MIKLNTDMISVLNVFTDGGARGNPGPAATGVYICDERNIQVGGFGKLLGIATNNVAEYKAVIQALDWIIENKKQLSENAKICFFLDSKLVCSQIIGLFKVKNVGLKDLLLDVRDREGQICLQMFYKHIPREKNSKADAYVNQALDGNGDVSFH
jgi:ribonuclease HI